MTWKIIKQMVQIRLKENRLKKPIVYNYCVIYHQAFTLVKRFRLVLLDRSIYLRKTCSWLKCCK